MIKNLRRFAASLIKPKFYLLRDFFNKNHLNFDYFSQRDNLGDILNKYLIEELTDKKVFEVRSQYYNKPHYFGIGSILQEVNSQSIVWGSGFISKNSFCLEKPKKVLAVRGPLSREKLINQGIDCPKVYGDPALLLPIVYPLKQKYKKYDLGIIPHYGDKKFSWLKQFTNSKKIKIIDIQTNDYKGFVDQIINCEKVISSSLHGIIISDAYRIPSLWVEFPSSKKEVVGNGFKFFDYFESVGKAVSKPFMIHDNTSIDEILNSFENFDFQFNYEQLLNSSPFEIKKCYQPNNEIT